MEDIKRLGYKEAEKNDLARAKEVAVKTDRKCFKCSHVIKAGQHAVTASHMVDKKYNVTLKELLLNDYIDTSNFKFVPVRHWVCEECAAKAIRLTRAKKFISKNRLPQHYKDSLEDLYNRGEITGKECDN